MNNLKTKPKNAAFSFYSNKMIRKEPKCAKKEKCRKVKKRMIYLMVVMPLDIFLLCIVNIFHIRLFFDNLISEINIYFITV